MAARHQQTRLRALLRHPRQSLRRKLNGCDICGFTGDDSATVFRKNSMGVWAASANSGCIFCCAVVSIIEDAREKHGIDLSDDGNVDVYLVADQSHEGGRFHLTPSPDDGRWLRLVPPKIVFYNELIDNGKVTSPLRGLPFDRNISFEAGSTECLDLIKGWMATCMSNHEACGEDSPQYMPTRVLDVRGKDGVKLVLASDLDPTTPFIALSHCWGLSQPRRTLKDNIDEHFKGIALNDLPLTFRDAVSLTKYLGIRYIWIDSLCIVQDDAQDWEKEASRMADVYSSARVVISATSSGGSDEGFLGPRDFTCAGVVEVPSPDKWHGICKIHYRRLNPHDPGNAPGSYSKGPLDTRAWTFQERMLARRYVSFGPDELRWECRSAVDCECDYLFVRRGEPSENLELMNRASMSIQPKIDESTDNELYYHWRQTVVYPYARRNLSFSSDKLIALSAVASEFQAKLNDQYIAGLWRKDIVREMSWYCEDEHQVLDTYMPSWSWASVVGSVHWSPILRNFQFETEFEVVNVECYPQSDIIPLGSVRKGASLTLRGKFCPGTVAYCPISHRICTYEIGGIGTNKLYCDSHLETVELPGNSGGVQKTARRSPHLRRGNLPSVAEDHPVWCFLVGVYRFGNAGNATALILGRSLDDPEKYQRLGLAEVNLGLQSSEDAFRGWTEETITIL